LCILSRGNATIITAAITASKAHFDRQYQTHLKHLKRKGLQPKTIEACSHAIRRIGVRFDHQIDSLTEAQLTDYFSELIASHSWSAVKLDLYGLKFYTMYVLRKPWVQSVTPDSMPRSRDGNALLCRTSAGNGLLAPYRLSCCAG